MLADDNGQSQCVGFPSEGLFEDGDYYLGEQYTLEGWFCSGLSICRRAQAAGAARPSTSSPSPAHRASTKNRTATKRAWTAADRAPLAGMVAISAVGP